MVEILSTRIHRPFSKLAQQLALSLSLLSSVSLAAAQTAPPRQVLAAPPPAAPAAPAAPAGGGYQAAPPPRQGDYQAAPPPQPGDYQAAPPAAPPPPPAGYPTQAPPQQYYQQQPQGYTTPPPGAYPAQPYAQQPYYQPYSTPGGVWQPTLQPRPRRGMMVAGASVFGGSYLLAMIVGAALIDNRDDWNDDSVSSDCRHCREVGRWLFVPVIGPFVGMSQSRDGDVGLLLLGMVQVVGVGLFTGGVIRYKASKKALEAQGMSWDLGNNRKLSLNMDSTPRSAGTRLRFDF